jgi:hypothetical protein
LLPSCTYGYITRSTPSSCSFRQTTRPPHISNSFCGEGTYFLPSCTYGYIIPSTPSSCSFRQTTRPPHTFSNFLGAGTYGYITRSTPSTCSIIQTTRCPLACPYSKPKGPWQHAYQPFLPYWPWPDLCHFHEKPGKKTLSFHTCGHIPSLFSPHHPLQDQNYHPARQAPKWPHYTP